MLICLFQFTLPCGERLSISFNSSLYILFQFTLPCGERPVSFEIYPLISLISIHAPVRGATSSSCFAFGSFRFQFTLPCGERRIRICNKIIRQEFQFTLPCGERQYIHFHLSLFLFISIHAPVRGATFLFILAFLTFLFQFTLPCGERHTGNSTTAEKQIISIHAPVRGATEDVLINVRSKIFQFTLPCGERLSGENIRFDSRRFQFTLPCGERRIKIQNKKNGI